MDGKSRWRGWLVPWLLGAAMQSGCQLFNPNITAEPPLANGPAGQNRLVAVAQPGVDPTTIKPLAVPTVPNSGGQSSYAPVSLSAPVLTRAAYPPPPPSVLLPPVTVTSLPTLPPLAQPAGQPPAGPSITFLEANADGDAHQLVRPSVGGAISNLPPGEHLVERLAEMTLRLQAKEEETKKLEARLQQLTAALEQRAQSVSQSTRGVQEATEEIRRTRTTLQSTRQEVDDAWAALRRRTKEGRYPTWSRISSRKWSDRPKIRLHQAMTTVLRRGHEVVVGTFKEGLTIRRARLIVLSAAVRAPCRWSSSARMVFMEDSPARPMTLPGAATRARGGGYGLITITPDGFVSSRDSAARGK